ncbi:MAG: tRNA uridine-5-carboxymethylaminomethyl(34) synthesis GTPase MnmE [Verrucomicrobiae bacterium]|nr:tRNA uridine-5-carboxymethylaminomethyl(34) synthesis GTPase MnmE [Verrucomicrobiae bacterium]
MNDDTIAAIATPPGQGAIALIRVSGEGAKSIAESVFSRSIETPRMQAFGRVKSAKSDDTIDEVLLTWFQSPHSYTGEDVIEISCHGGMLVTQKVLERILEAGARPAEAGEFSQRAFFNGKMDLTQAEAVMDLISAQTDLALKAAHEQLSGRLGNALTRLREELIGIVAHVEAYIDFPEEDIDPETGEALLSRIDVARKSVDQLIATADQGRILREGVRTVICGAPNVGKSSLLNVLLGFDRAIVSETAGTTRDTIEEVINLRGIPIRLIDTAGVRESNDLIEREGITRTQAQIAHAELVLEMVDVSESKSRSGSGEIAASIPAGTHHLRLLNKIDRGEHTDWRDVEGVRLSCLEETGMDSLTEAIFEKLGGPGANWGADLVAINARHKRCLNRASEDLGNARHRLASGESPEFVALDLRSALDAIGEVVGKTDVEEILGEIFSTFCIGK